MRRLNLKVYNLDTVSIIKEIRQLSVEERILMIEAIWDSVEEDTGSTELTKEQEAELCRRIQRYESGEAITYSWEEVTARLTNKRID